jgi:topoisomerase IA-like protein
MENKLDEIANGNESFVAKTCDQDIQNCIKAIKTIEKPTFPVKNSDEFVIVYERYGPVLRKVLEDGSYHYENIRQDLEMDKLRSGEYSLEEILRKDELLGEHEGYPVLLKSGPYGEYISYKNETTNISSIQSDISDGGSGLLDGFIKYIKAKSESGSQNIIRELTKEISIRNGKYGAYIFYQTEKMKKPKFFNLNNFKESYKYCSEESLLKWIKEKHNIS